MTSTTCSTLRPDRTSVSGMRQRWSAGRPRSGWWPSSTDLRCHEGDCRYVHPVDDGRDRGSAANLAWWQEAAPLHAGSGFYDLEGLRSGRDVMRPHEVAEIGEVSGRDLVHLQCHIGTDTVSWARRGARTVGLDFSSNSIEVAGRLAAECGVDIEFVCADVYDAPEALGHRRFDTVYTGIGALNWLADLPGWARVVDAAPPPRRDALSLRDPPRGARSLRGRTDARRATSSTPGTG